MRKRVIIGLLATAVCAVPLITYAVKASTVANETEMAGMSMMIEEYYYSQSAGNQTENVITDPEAVVPESDSDTGNYAGVTDVAGMSVNPEVTQAPVQPAEQTAAGAEAVDGAEAAAPQPEEAVEPEQPEEKSEFENVGISIANEYVHIRKRPTTESKILGKLYRGSAATILKKKGDWVRIKSGSVEGFIKAEYLAIGKKAEKIADKYGTRIATVTTTTLKVREERNTECTVLTLIPEGEEYEVTKVYKDWVKIIVDEGTKGYVSREFVKMSMEFGEAISKEEEEEIERRRQEAAREAEEAARAAYQAAQAAKAAQQSASSSHSSSSNSSSASHSSSSSSSSGSGKTDTSKVTTGSGTGSDVASYAQKFIGNPYSYGGTSLTNGTDCSGFVQSVYGKYGYSLPRTSGSQAGSGKSVSLDNVQAGDIIYYSSGGSVNHVAIYIGDGKVVHASNKRTGITVSNMRYRTPSGARRVAN